MPVETKNWTGKPRISWRVKINPLWWFGNVEGIDASYHTEWPQWRRMLVWYVIRNPMFNFLRFVVGVEDRDLIVTGPAPVFAVVWSDVGFQLGVKWSIIRTGFAVLPFISYTGMQWTLYLGWLPSGGRLGAKINYRS